MWEARARIGRYFHFYNDERLHQSLGYRTPASLYRSKEKRGDCDHSISWISSIAVLNQCYGHPEIGRAHV